MVKPLVILGLLAASGCVIRTTRARDATLHYHPTLDELKAAPRRSAVPARPPAPSAARLRLDEIAAGYPQPIGLDYDGAGAFRKVVGVEWSQGEVEAALGRRLRTVFTDDRQATTSLGGGLVSVAVYRLGGATYANALLEVRLVRDGDEIYAARYRAAARGRDRAMLLESVGIELADRVADDAALAAAVDGGAP